MKVKSGSSLFRLVMVVAVAALILGAVQLAPGVAAAEPVDELSIYLNGTFLESYTIAELKTLFDQQEYTLSGFNTYPTQKDYMVKGPRLDHVLYDAGMPGNAQTLKLTANDGVYMTFTVDELINTSGLQPRYSSYENGVVYTILALQNAELDLESGEFGQMTDSDAIRLMMGQRRIQALDGNDEQTNVWQCKYIERIDISTTNPGQWNLEDITAELSGTQVTLHHPSADLLRRANIGTKIYYTTDGSAPTINSKMFNVSAWVLPNPTIQLNSGYNIIRAIVIGPGYYNSAVQAFEYYN